MLKFFVLPAKDKAVSSQYGLELILQLSRSTVAIRVLIADDHVLIRKGMRSVLSAEGAEVCGEAANGSEAVDMALQLRPDLVILDVTMPVMGGFEAAKKLHKIVPDVPILFYSFHDSTQLIKEVRRIGVQGYVNKSQISDVLAQAVNALVVQRTTFFPEPAPALTAK